MVAVLPCANCHHWLLTLSPVVFITFAFAFFACRQGAAAADFVALCVCVCLCVQCLMERESR